MSDFLKKVKELEKEAIKQRKQTRANERSSPRGHEPTTRKSQPSQPKDILKELGAEKYLRDIRRLWKKGGVRRDEWGVSLDYSYRETFTTYQMDYGPGGHGVSPVYTSERSTVELSQSISISDTHGDWVRVRGSGYSRELGDADGEHYDYTYPFGHKTKEIFEQKLAALAIKYKPR